MNRAERRRSQKRNTKEPKRKQPGTVEAVVGMLESSARLDGVAAEKRRSEAAEFGRSTGKRMESHGESNEVIDILGGYSLGIFLSAQILAGQAAELALKYTYEQEFPGRVACTTHDLGALYEQLSMARKERIEADYATRIQRHESSPGNGWETARNAFRSGRDYPVLFRYATEEGQAIPWVEPIFLREAVCSVLASLGFNIRWGSNGRS